MKTFSEFVSAIDPEFLESFSKDEEKPGKKMPPWLKDKKGDKCDDKCDDKADKGDKADAKDDKKSAKKDNPFLKGKKKED